VKVFDSAHLRDGLAFVAAGAQALHVWRVAWAGTKPRCFVDGRLWGHLMDRDEARLVRTARRLGVCKIKVDRLGKRGQHIDLCGRPLERAIEEAEA